jgi:hypothetical protein
MTTKDEALKLALEVLEHIDYEDRDRDFLFQYQCTMLDKAITAIKQALTDSALDRMAENARELGMDYEPAQEPVAWVTGLHAGRCVIQTINPAAILPVGIALYTTPPNVATPLAAQRQWQGLTDEEKQEWIDAMPYTIEPRHCMILVNVMEAKLKEKNCD